jgi:hypothetical protein
MNCTALRDAIKMAFVSVVCRFGWKEVESLSVACTLLMEDWAKHDVVA